MKATATLVAAVVLVLASAREVMAQHVGDVYVGLDGPQVIVGSIGAAQQVDTTVRVFASAFGDSGFPQFTSNPGFDGALVFNPSYRIGFNMLDALQRWNGSSFEPAENETLNISFLTLERGTAACFVAGFDLAVQSNGGWHRHFNFVLESASQPVPPAGVYMAKLELYYTAPGSVKSEPFWIVFNHGVAPAAHAAAVDWAITHLVNPDCLADADYSGVVNIDDLLAVVNAWGSTPCAAGDLNDDGIVNIDDLLQIINDWGSCP